VRNESGGKDSFTLGQFGAVLGGPIKRERVFFFVAAERQVLNASKESNFAVPTVEQRGAFGSGATGITSNPFVPNPCGPNNPSACLRFYPVSAGGNLIFSLFPFPNNPNGIYGGNTFTRILPASARGLDLSGKIDGNFRFRERQQSVTARYNFTEDDREIPVTGGALFSTLRPDVRTQNLSLFLNSQVSGPNSTKPIFNLVRLSYGRTRLNFEEVRDEAFLSPSRLLPGTPFLLNRPLLTSFSLPPAPGVPNPSAVFYRTPFRNATDPFTVEEFLGPVGQVNIAGYSPLGVDVFNFPQRRVNNTYQVADTLTLRTGGHNLSFGTDIRRTELNSDLSRNARPLITFNGAPALLNNTLTFINPLDLAAAGAATGFFQTLTNGGGSNINLRYYQLDFFGQDEWRVRPNLSLSFGLRYEYNTPPREVSRRIESTFDSPLLNLLPELRQFIDGRTEIFEPDSNNFAPRVGIAYSPNFFGRDRATVLRAGYGLFYDQILGAVVSQSRNVFPNFLTLNTGGGLGSVNGTPFDLFNPATGGLCFAFQQNGACSDFRPFVLPNTLNTFNPALGLSNLVGSALRDFAGGFGATFPARQLETPMAHHYSFTFEQQLGANLAVSAAYVGTMGRNLIRFTTPNLGQNVILVPFDFEATVIDSTGNPNFTPRFSGVAIPPGFGRPTSGVGAVNIFETTAESRYDSLQLQLRGRLKFITTTQFQVSYTFSKTTDDVSDVFDLAGAPALPQNSLTFAGERGPANFDVRHRFSYNTISTLPSFSNRSPVLRFLLGSLQFASTTTFQSGQPFTVNSIFDVNLDGNLTDRLDNINGITVTGNRAQPLVLSQQVRNNPGLVLAALGEDGSIGRNSFRAGNFMLSNIAIIKNFAITENQRLIFRMDVFNLFNRANYGIPVRFLEAPGFGQATDTVTPARRIQFALKYSF
ncbi:MAG: hypothetical protein ICV68_06025, partial [Pyrinomonadaceae bacterium]|nr:hypothetical protein [Pyrinomonadaceae bacterium]